MNTKLTKLDEQVTAAGQINMDDLREIAISGYKAVICNRPDFEGGLDQPTSKQLGELAKSLGVAFAYLPVAMGSVSTEHGKKFKELLDTLPRPVVAFCGSGKRATALHGLSKDL
jgi:sulfide:quinone oxidoreductase